MAYKFGTPSSPTGTVTDVSGAQSTDASTGVVFSVTLNITGTNTLENPTNVQEGQKYTWHLKQDSSVAVDVTFGDDFYFAGGVTPTITQVAGAVDIVRATAIDDGAGNIKLYSEFEADVKAQPMSNTYSYDAVGNSFTSVLTFDPADTSSWSDVSSGPLYDVFEHTNAFSFSAWVKNSWTSGGNVYFAGRYSYSDVTGLGIGVTGTLGGGGKLLIWYITSTGQAHYLYAGGVADGNWHHVTLTYDGSGLHTGWSAYIDGSPSALTANTSDTMTSGTTKVGETPFALGWLRGHMGDYPTTSAIYPGKLEEVSVWDTELSASDVTAIWNSGTPNDLNSHTQAASLISWWRMGDASGDNLTGTNPSTNASVNVIKDVSTASGYSRSDGAAMERTASSGQADFVTDVPT